MIATLGEDMLGVVDNDEREIQAGICMKIKVCPCLTIQYVTESAR